MAVKGYLPLQNIIRFSLPFPDINFPSVFVCPLPYEKQYWLCTHDSVDSLNHLFLCENCGKMVVLWLLKNILPTLPPVYEKNSHLQ